MDRKLKNTIILISILLLIIIAGSVYTFYFQSNKIDERKTEIKKLEPQAFNTEELLAQLKNLQERARELDSILALRKFNIPVALKQSAFYNFVNKISFSFQPYSYVNIEYQTVDHKEHFSYYTYKLAGVGSFNDVYKLIYGIEQSKELKKVVSINFNDFVKVDEEGDAYYLVNYEISTTVYFSSSDRFASAKFKENRLIPNPLYDVFFPLIRNEIPPNKDNLLDVQTASLLAIIPDGAFISNDQGETFLLWEGDKVYLGYLTEIDYETNEVRFVLNKGGIIEKITLQLQKDNKTE